MAAPMFAHAVAAGDPCKACKTAGRRLVSTGFVPMARVIHLEILAAAGSTWTACPICDQSPADAPSWR